MNALQNVPRYIGFNALFEKIEKKCTHLFMLACAACADALPHPLE